MKYLLFFILIIFGSHSYSSFCQNYKWQMILQTDTMLYGVNIDDLKAKTQTDFIYSSRITKIINNSQPPIFCFY